MTKKAAAVITLQNDGSYYLEARGNKMTLRYHSKWDQWEMFCDNASRQAWSGPGIKMFNSLKEVEKKYKTWAGICAVVALNETGMAH
ncbi:hypothetical protein C3Z09_22165 [Lelliottia aquatilis]|uniref:hypothetical protein n=1 Tax=Lelliottia aquatilis TaxID=2080838 RepID=UPI000CDEDCF6|nr:hypothetical protein [Lelliottia aquatilis]NTZ48356.1 hypothetical protein [Lelliottia aquatilis]POZ13648.1 hypothetical protein C3Z09_22165 [Lelliottia aquatilis]